MNEIRTFRTTPEIEQLLEDIPYGKRSDFIKNCILIANGEAIEKMVNNQKKSVMEAPPTLSPTSQLKPAAPMKHKNSKSSVNLPTNSKHSKTPVSNSEAAATTAAKSETRSSRLRNMKKLLQERG